MKVCRDPVLRRKPGGGCQRPFGPHSTNGPTKNFSVLKRRLSVKINMEPKVMAVWWPNDFPEPFKEVILNSFHVNWSQGVITVKLPHEVYKLHLKRQKQYCWLTDIHNLPMLKCIRHPEAEPEPSWGLANTSISIGSWLPRSPKVWGSKKIASRNHNGGGSKSITPYFKKNRVNLTWYLVLVYPEMVLSKTICMSSYDLHVLVFSIRKNLPYLHLVGGFNPFEKY